MNVCRLICALFIGWGLTGPLVSAAEPVRFARDIRPILADNCARCHGPDAAARQADLRLDTRAGLQARIDGEPLIQPGQPEQSLLWQRLIHADPEQRMPPADSGKTLTDRQRDLIRQWIQSGAKWEEHWSFVPPVKSTLPTVQRPAWPRTPIDAWVLAALEQRQMPPSVEAPAETLIRRVTRDLTGLPPTLLEVDAYLADSSPDRYERLVDRLLASPRFGEHLATEWLDAARYADTSGYQNDGPREMWRWRDWVIDAYNANLPFNDFTVQQLAGDLLPDATLSTRIATGFHRNHRGNSEGGIIPEEYAVEYVVDRVDTTGAVWLGLTIGCARCHSHKYDPLTQREYYQLFAYFNNVPELGRSIKEGNSPPIIEAPTEDDARHLESLRHQREKLERQWHDQNRFGGFSGQAQWEETLRNQPVDWSPTSHLVARYSLRNDLQDELTPSRTTTLNAGTAHFVESPIGPALQLTDEQFVTAGDVGKFGYRDAFSVSLWVRPDRTESGGLISRRMDDEYAEGWSIEFAHGHLQANFVKRRLDDALRVQTEQPIKSGEWQHVTVTYDGTRTARGVEFYINGVAQKKHVLLDGLNQTFLTEEPLRIGSSGSVKPLTGALSDVRIYGRTVSSREAEQLAVPESLAALVLIPEEDRTSAQLSKLQDAFLTLGAKPEVNILWRLWRAAQERERQFAANLPTTMVMTERGDRRAAHVLKRGAYDQPGESVEPAVPAVLIAGREPVGSSRLDLARWIVDPQQPLTARVAVNRHWQRLFGTGLVKTAEDFGTQGEPPSHPELLDWLAVEFVKSRWDVKRLLRLIVTSAAYQQSSAVTPALIQADPENRFLARGPRFRLPAEMLRDQALAVSGLLEERLGGRSVRPYQPAGLWKEIATDTDYEPSVGPDLYRRTLYGYWKRTVLNPTLAVFDAPTREACVLRRSRTNTPLQALTLLNDVTFVEPARVLAESVVQTSGDDEARIADLVQRVLGRAATSSERTLLIETLREQRAVFATDPSAAAAIAASGSAPRSVSNRDADVAAWTVVAALLLNLDEFVTKE